MTTRRLMKKILAGLGVALFVLWATAPPVWVHADTYRIPVTPSAITQTLFGSLELRDQTVLAAESLNETGFATTVKWTAAGDFAFAGQKAVYTHAAGSGTVTQTSANGATAWATTGANSWYKLTYTTSSITGSPVCTVPATFALAAQTLTVSPAATYTTYFKLKAATVGDFVISCTSGAAATVSFDDVSLKQVTGGSLTANGQVLVGNGSAAAPSYSFVAEPGTGFYLTPSIGLDVSYGGVQKFRFNSSQFIPVATDAYQLGGTTTAWVDLFLSRSTQGSKSKSLTDAAAAVTFPRIAVPTGAIVAGEGIWTATSTGGAKVRGVQGRFSYAFSNDAGTVTNAAVNVIDTDTPVSGDASAIACTWSSAVSTTNGDLQVTCTDNEAGAQTILVYLRLDMPITATVSYP